MSQLGTVISLSRQLQRLERRSRYEWASYCKARAEGDDVEAVREWIDLTRTQYAIAALLEAVHVASKGAYNNHIYATVDSRESATGTPSRMKGIA